MKPNDVIRLLFLSAIWGGSFIFMRILSPIMGPVLTTDLRVTIAGLVLLIYFLIIRFNLEWRKYWNHYLVIGIIISAIPFFLYSYAALYIPASYSVILNATAPLFGAFFSSIWLQERLNSTMGAGLILGALGVGLVAKVGPVELSPKVLIAGAACRLAAICYGLGGVYIKKYSAHVKPKAIACASQLMAGLALLPWAFRSKNSFEITPSLALTVVVFAVLCSAIAYLLYYRLITDIGPTKALTVTFLMPIFGIIWGSLFLGEKLTIGMTIGCLIIVLGTALVLNVLKLPERMGLNVA